MNPRAQSRALRWGFVVVFLLALLPRLFYPVSRPKQWWERSVVFWDALLAGDLRGTYQQYHPGVTTMWVAGLGMRVYAAAQDWSAGIVGSTPPAREGFSLYPVEAGVAALSFAIAACVGLAYLLLARLTDWRVAFSGGCLLALDPFHIAQSKVLHVDAMLASLMLVSVLFLICHLRLRRMSYLALSGVFAGLAFLTKSPSGLLLPFTLLAIVSFSLLRLRIAGGYEAKHSERVHLWRQRVGIAFRAIGIWGIAASLVFILLWPAMWCAPIEVTSEVLQAALDRAEIPHSVNFFAGRIINDDPGWLYYVATVAWKTTLVTLPTSCMAIFLLIRQWKRRGDTAPIWWMLIFAVGFFVMMALAAKKGPRYLLPVFPPLDLLAAWGLVQVAGAVGRWRTLRERTWIPAAIIATALTTHAVAALRHHPYYGTHHNLLLGGSRVAQHILPVGDQGEGMDLAARFLNSYPRTERMVVGLQRTYISQFGRYFAGRAGPVEVSDADYWIFAVNSNQRLLKAHRWWEVWEANQQSEPIWSVSFDGVPYVWMYRAYPHDPDAFAIEQRVDSQLGEHVRLLGYALGSSDLQAGDTLTVTLFWQSDGRLTQNYHIFLHLLNADGDLVAQHDGVPAQGARPTKSWWDTEVIRDEHVLVTDASLPGGVYTLFTGMYDLPTGVRLPAVNSAGEPLVDDCIPLGSVQLILP